MNKKVILILIVLLALIGFFGWKQLHSNQASSLPKETPKQTDNPNDSPRIVSTSPDPLEDNIVSATQTIEITFNRSLQNSGEFKLRIDPKIDLKVELSSDRKTAKITPIKPFELGLTYTIFIGTDTKFDGVGPWNQEKIYHFRTVKYTGV